MDVVYSQAGVGEPIVLVHGFLEGRTMWDEYAQKLSSSFNVICPDLLGHGETENLGYVHSMEDQADAVVAVLNAESVKACTIIGHSMGGYVALALAEAHPELVTRLALFHSTAYPDSDEKKKDRERVVDLVQRNKDVYVKAAIPSLFAEGNRESLKNEIQNRIDIANGFSAQGIIANVHGMKERQDRTEVLKNGSFKKLILHGELDPVIPTKDVEALAALSDDIRLEVVNHIGHMGYLEAPEGCLNIIRSFCES